MIRTVITGSGGFIGSRLFSKIPASIDIHNDEFKWFDGRKKCDRVFFLSTYGNMSHHKNHAKIVKANVDDLFTVIRYSSVNWFCYMSSSSVTLPVQTPYSRTKRAAEEILQALPELKSCIVRPYSVTGVGEQKEHLIPTLIRSCMEGEEMPFDPCPVHDFIDVEDVVDALVMLADKQVTGIIELGSGIPHSNLEVKDLVEHMCQKKANIIPKRGLRQYDNDKWFCKNSWWVTRKSLAKSIEEMVQSYLQRLVLDKKLGYTLK